MWSGPGTVAFEPQSPAAGPTMTGLTTPSGAPSGVSFTTLTPGINTAIDAGVKAFSSGDFDSARRAFADAVAEDPADPFGRILYGLTWFAQGDFTRATRAIHAALTDVPEAIQRPLDLSPLYTDPSVLAAHIDRLTQECARYPDNGDFSFLLAYVLFATEQPKAAYGAILAIHGPASTNDVVMALRDTLASIQTAPDSPAP